MARASRQNQDPPPDFFRDVIVALKLLFPQANVDRSLMMELAPYLAEQWQAGRDARGAVQATCSCDGSKIFLSPATQMKTLPKAARIALPPLGAKPGDVFGAEDLRDPGPLLRLKVAIAVKKAKAEVRAKMAEIADQRVKLARSEPARNRAQLLYARYAHERDTLNQEATALEAQLKDVLKGLTPPKKPNAAKESAKAGSAASTSKRGRRKGTPATAAGQAAAPSASAPTPAVTPQAKDTPASKAAPATPTGTSDEEAERKLNAKARELFPDEEE